MITIGQSFRKIKALMRNSNRKLAACAFVAGLLITTLTACGKPEASAPASPAMSSPSMSSPAAGSAMTSTGTNVDGLLSVVNNTKAAVEANDFPKATAAFEQFEGSWKPVEDGVKAKSKDGYDKIEASMDEVRGALKTSDQKKSMAALQSMTEHVNSVK